MEMSDKLHTLADLLLGKEHPVPLNRKLCGPQNWYAHDDKEKISLLCPVRN
jgi:hypothetical protein